jgi:CelD/BcsL family acetyltransferase involved in cellulose biosynthesis
VTGEMLDRLSRTGGPSLQVEVVRPEELGRPELDLWHEFQRTTPALDNPVLSPEFTVAVGRVRSAARVGVLSDAGQIVGFFPFERRRLRAGVPIAAGLTGCQGLVHAPDVDWDPGQLLRACGLSVWEFDSLVDGQRPFRPYGAISAPSPVMDLSRGFEHYVDDLRQRSPKLIRGLAYKRRKLAREAGEVHFEADSRDPAVLRALMGWKSAQYRRTGRSDRFAWPGVVELVQDLMDTRTSSFSGGLSVLHVGDRPAAAFFLLRSEHAVVDWFPGYDPAFSRWSPGLLIRLDVAAAEAARGICHLHMGRGTRDRYKQWFRSHDVPVTEGRVLRRTPTAALHWVRAAPARRVRHAVTESPRMLQAADAVLYRYGRMRVALGRRVEPDGGSR